MPTLSSRTFASGPHLPASADQAERLLRHMQRIHNHDLPNQMVALQSLLQLLNFEESQKLSDDGREYVRRLQNAARRASEMVGYLKDMGRLNSFVCKVEAIALANLARELQGQLQRLFPDKQFTFDWHWAAPTIVGDSRVFLHAISELCKAFYTGAATSCVVQATSRQHGGAIQLSFNIRNQFMPDCQLMDHAEPVAPACPLSERLEIILAREWLALCGSDVEILGHGETEAVFSIVTPSR